MACTGLFGDYQAIMLLGIVSGIGIAAYHPEAARLVNFAAGKNKGTAMSLFGIGGTLGFALGPLIVTAAMLKWGMQGTLVLAIPVTIMALVIIFHFPMLQSLEADENQKKGSSATDTVRENWSGFSRIALIVSGRSILFFGLNIFIPIYWINELGQSKVAGAMALTIFAGAGIFGNLAGGNMADRIGQKKVLLIGLLGLTLLLPILILVENVQLATFLLAPIGFMLFTTYSPAIVMGQSYLPSRIGLASGVTLGLGVAIGGGAAPFIGKLADLYGVWMALASVAFLPIFILLLAWSLPEPEEQPVLVKAVKGNF
jgi:FSR family fosmidomycin resistance protein-like MFS transporter